MTILGTWRLLSCTAKSCEAAVFFPYGEKPIGQLMYGADGFMSVLLMNSERALFRSEDLAATSSEEKVSAFDSFDAYVGRYTLDLKAGIIVHHIEAAKIPNWVNLSHSRAFVLNQDALTLKTEPFQMMGQTWTVEVCWTRLE